MYKEIDKNVGWKDITPGGTVYTAGNSVEFLTGDWRTMKPVFIKENCRDCFLCIPVCPDSSIYIAGGRRSDFDYGHCKGCGVCAKVCPFGAIEMEKEQGGAV